MTSSRRLSLVTPEGSGANTCGYCSPPGTRSKDERSFKSASLLGIQLSCEVYQHMIDIGWRRSGTYCYKPDLRRSCCPQYTIKLDALKFKLSKSQRKLLNRWNRFVLGGGEKYASINMRANENRSPEEPPISSLITMMHSSEQNRIDDQLLAHKFEVSLEPSSLTKEKYELFKNYQLQIHHDHNSSPSGFNRFLVESPLLNEPIPYTTTPPSHFPINYGSYHQLYRLDGELIAMSVIDILPYCVSSVYFMYDKKWERFSLGKLSALREVSLVQEMHELGAPEMDFLYMGYYIHSCQKMRYKADLSPSFLADPETHNWFPLETCKPLLDKYRYACFAHPDNSTRDIPSSVEETTYEIPDELLQRVLIVSSVQGGKLTVVPVQASEDWKRARNRRAISSSIIGLGPELSKDVIFGF